MDSNSKNFIAGHRGLVGSAVCRNLKSNGYTNILTSSRAELDLRIQKDVDEFFEAERPEYVFLAWLQKLVGLVLIKQHPQISLEITCRFKLMLLMLLIGMVAKNFFSLDLLASIQRWHKFQSKKSI